MAGGLTAGAAAGGDMTVLKNSNILVRVEEALADLLVVSYRPQDADALYQGVLLHSNKTNLPYGVHSLHPAFLTQGKGNASDDRLHSVSQRFAYQEPQYARPLPPVKGKPRARQKMTVRLRPRKVLCSKCQGICNENSENVATDRKRKAPRPSALPSDDEKTFLMGNSLIPKLSRLQPSEISNAINGGAADKSKPRRSADASVNTSKSDTDDGDSTVARELTFVDVSSDSGKRTVNDKIESEEPNTNSFGSVFSSARTLKICFGEGEGTVVKIPAIVADFNDETDVSSSDVAKSLVDSKAAKRALKRAKKQAKKNVSTEPGSPAQVAPVVSPRHIGALSPRNNVASNTPTADELHKRHRHKVKHKKKRRTERRHERDENTSKSLDGASNDDADDHSLDQKLSINLKRLNRSVRHPSESGSEGGEEGVPEFPVAGACDSGPGAVGGGGCLTGAGEVVWGKLAGFPWWPGRVLSVSAAGFAHISWYASTTCSHIHCSSICPFFEDYKVRFNKKKRGAYKEAVRLATLDARRKETQAQDPLGSSSPSVLPTVSPRPIDVFS